jgi:CHAD domain-containing protein
VFLAARLSDVERNRVLAERRLAPGVVHDLRVAVRRLRGAVRLFGRHPAVKRADAELGRLQEALGTLRDHQVQLAALSRLARAVPAEQAQVVSDVRGTVGKARPEVFQAARKQLERWARSGRGLISDVRGLRPGGRLGGHRMRNRLVHQVETVEELAEAALAEPTPPAMHRLRIAVKRFRYALEFLEPALPAQTAVIRDALVPLQTGLGDLHDLDVQLVLVGRHASPGSLRATADLLQQLHAVRARKAAALTEKLRSWEEEATALRTQILLGPSPLRLEKRIR